MGSATTVAASTLSVGVVAAESRADFLGPQQSAERATTIIKTIFLMEFVLFF
jgi:hypothetical protein